jgi:death-on-curing protein
MFFPDKKKILQLHVNLIKQSGGAEGVRDVDILDSCLARPFQTFGGVDLYPSIVEKAMALGFFLVKNHPFIDGNKRIGQAAMEVTLGLNGWLIQASIDEQEKLILDLAEGKLDKETFFDWVKAHLHPISL